MPLETSFDATFTAALAQREKQVQQAYRPIIGTHKWFARRPGTVFRNLLLAEFNGREDASAGYWRAHQMQGVIADPFMGGGTPLYEANRLGFSVVGTDINPMSFWTVRQSLAPLDLADFEAVAKEVIDDVEAAVGAHYMTTCDECDEPTPVKYFLWVKVQECPGCETDVDLFPGYLIAEDERHPRNVLICGGCGALNEVEALPANDKHPAKCHECGSPVNVDGPARKNSVACPNCSATFKYPPRVPRSAPRHRLVAMEYFCERCKKGHAGRFFKSAGAEDLARFARAAAQLHAEEERLPIPDDRIPAGDETDRLLRWGYRRYREMFNDRQLLGLGVLLRRIKEVKASSPRHALLTVFSDFLRYQNMLCRYDTYALKCQDIFSVHGFPVGLIQCEDSLLGVPRVGSGSFRHFVEKYLRAKAYCVHPFETRFTGKKKEVVEIVGERIGADFVDRFPSATAREALVAACPAETLELPEDSLDGVFTDPPYFDNVQYAELMDFCYVWLRKALRQEFTEFRSTSTRSDAELTGNATRGRGLDEFTKGLSMVFSHYAAALKSGAPFVFTYHHNEAVAYAPLVVAILDAGLHCTAALPAPAEMGASLHIAGTGSSVLDTVFVCRRGAPPVADARTVEQLLERDLVALRAAGLAISKGDVRCLLAGHLARRAVNVLHPHWQPWLSLTKRLAHVRHVLSQGDLPPSLMVGQRTGGHVSHPFELSAADLTSHLNEMASVTIADLTSSFLLIPRGENFLEYEDFRSAYDALGQNTTGFTQFDEPSVWKALKVNARAFCVLRAILGMTAPEWADLACSEEKSDVEQGAARTMDRNCRARPDYFATIIAKHEGRKADGVKEKVAPPKPLARAEAMVRVAIRYIKKGAPENLDGVLHRLAKFDTQEGLTSVRHAATDDVPYPVLLYERFLGRPFASHRDAVSEVVGEVMEDAVEEVLKAAGVPYRKTKRAERVPKFDQAPDFFVPDETAPIAVIEAKIASDDGTARDKHTRMKNLVTQRDEHVQSKRFSHYEVIACIDGRGFGIRQEDMRQLLQRLGGKVFTAATLDQLVDHTRLHEKRGVNPAPPAAAID